MDYRGSYTRPHGSSQAVIVMEIAAPNGTIARTVSSVSPHAEFTKALQRHYMQELHQ